MILHYRYTVSSTNDWAKHIQVGSIPHTLYTSFQTKGRGRQTRRWLSSPSDNILMSIVHRHFLPSNIPWIYGLYAAYSVITFLKSLGITPYFKWPNDVWTRQGKICGILPEAIWQDNTIEKIIVGIGININESHFPSDIPGTSVYLETGNTYNIHYLVRHVAHIYFSQLEIISTETLISYLWEYFIWKDRNVVVLPDNIKGKAIAIKSDGSLVLESVDGKHTVVQWGELSLRDDMK